MTYRYQILLGRISRINGYDGSVSVKLEKSFLDKIPEMKSVFLEINGKPVPFFISLSEYSGGDILKLRFEGYESYEKVSEFAGCRVYLTSINEEPSQQKNPKIFWDSGISSEQNLIAVRNSSESGSGSAENNLLRIKILIPFHEVHCKLDTKKKTIRVELPEGLTDIN
jgi:ribosomal 30S subunit maturation factor RimM